MKTSTSITRAVQQFDTMPDQALVDFNSAEVITDRSRASLYRHCKAGELTLVKIGHSSKLRVGELRRLIGAE